ncbi:MAG TPA: iron-containing alcohol dehydrogenase [Terriglobia bacterium]|nr:iron-containing alcohol dehydrogenase [Terriglobia bacterium]
MILRFDSPGTILTGGGCRKQTAEILSALRARRTFVVTDPFFLTSNFLAEILSGLSAAGIAAKVFSGFQPDPEDRNVVAGVGGFRAFGGDSILAIGGGSAIDVAKIIGASSANPGPLSAFQGYHRIPNAGPPLVVLPTTAGTGSEATKVAVITDTTRNVKMMILDSKLMPAAAIVDFELTLSMPKPLTAHVGVDTLTHGIEAYVSRRANALTDPIAASCIAKTQTFLRKAWANPTDLEAREAMSFAALQGGLAFTNSSVCLVHGMSRPLGAVFHLPHGLSNAALLPAVTRFSWRGAMERYANVARTMNLADAKRSDTYACESLVECLDALNQELEVPKLRDCCRATADEFHAAVPKMASDALESGSPQNNPVVPAAEQIMELFDQAW